MQAKTVELRTIFTKDVRFEVPLYQRAYVWTTKKQLAPFVDDVLGVATRLVDAGDAAPAVAPHFMGAIVLDPAWTSTSDLETRLVVDGQQRLTTLQIFISAAAFVLSGEGHEKHSRLLRGLIDNNPDLVESAADAYKVWPTNTNRDAFSAVMRPDGPPADRADDPDNRIDEAWQYFADRVREWLAASADESADADGRAQALSRTVRTLIKLVVIDLEAEDDAQVIFETLNAGGQKLLAIDLVKNLVFQQARIAGYSETQLDSLYHDQWARFDQGWWQTEITQGRLKRVRAEQFLMHWLIMQLRDDVVVDHVFTTFRSYVASNTAPLADIIDEFVRDARIYEQLELEPPSAAVGQLLATMRQLELSVAHPLVLWLCRQSHEVLDASDRDRAAGMLESYFARRALLRATSANYNRFVCALLEACAHAASRGASVVEALADRLGGDSPSTRFPDDEWLVRDLARMDAYKHKRARLRFFLHEIERSLRTGKDEPVVVDFDKLTVEHVMPQRWEQHWSLDEDADPVQGRIARGARIHRFGNLTLITGKLNSSVSHQPWATKRGALEKFSGLVMNRRICELDVWDDSVIDARCVDFAARLTRRWPSLEHWRGAGDKDVVADPPVDSSLLERVRVELADGTPARVDRRATSLAQLIEDGIVEPGTEVHAIHSGIRHTAIITQEGLILRPGGEAGAPSATAREITGWSVNGWGFWRIAHPQLGEPTLDEVRAWAGGDVGSGDVDSDAGGADRDELMATVVRLRDDEGMTWVDIADSVGRDYGTTKSLYLSATIPQSIWWTDQSDLDQHVVRLRDEDNLAWYVIGCHLGVSQNKAKRCYERATGRSARQGQRVLKRRVGSVARTKSWTPQVEHLYQLMSTRWEAGDEFSLADVYTLKQQLAVHYPRNTNLDAAMRLALQIMRDSEVVDFVDDNGTYRLLS